MPSFPGRGHDALVPSAQGEARAGTIGFPIHGDRSMSDALLYEIDGAVALLTINRPDERNLLGRIGDGELFEQAAERIRSNTEIRCAILTGAGSAFSSGGDVKAMRERSGPFAGGSATLRENYRGEIHRMVRALWNLDVPLIAAVNGPAIGLGNDVACLADIRLASDKALFGQTFLKLGLIPGDGGAWILQQLIGYSRAAQMLFTGQLIDAATAQEWGLVSEVTATGELLPRARELAGEVAKQPPMALRMAKQLLRSGRQDRFESVMEFSANLQGILQRTADHDEALAAFFEKRPPNFTGN